MVPSREVPNTKGRNISGLSTMGVPNMTGSLMQKIPGIRDTLETSRRVADLERSQMMTRGRVMPTPPIMVQE